MIQPEGHLQLFRSFRSLSLSAISSAFQVWRFKDEPCIIINLICALFHYWHPSDKKKNSRQTPLSLCSLLPSYWQDQRSVLKRLTSYPFLTSVPLLHIQPFSGLPCWPGTYLLLFIEASVTACRYFCPRYTTLRIVLDLQLLSVLLYTPERDHTFQAGMPLSTTEKMAIPH